MHISQNTGLSVNVFVPSLWRIWKPVQTHERLTSFHAVSESNFRKFAGNESQPIFLPSNADNEPWTMMTRREKESIGELMRREKGSIRRANKMSENIIARGITKRGWLNWSYGSLDGKSHGIRRIGNENDLWILGGLLELNAYCSKVGIYRKNVVLIIAYSYKTYTQKWSLKFFLSEDRFSSILM